MMKIRLFYDLKNTCKQERISKNQKRNEETTDDENHWSI